jgi:ABC-type uncharacterized transport system involved in gliding motility auxiliary subunit
MAWVKIIETIKGNKNRIINIVAIVGLILLLIGSLIYVTYPVIKWYTILLLLLGVLSVVAYACNNFSAIKSFILRKTTMYGINTILSTVFVFGILVFVYSIIARHNVELDLTKNKRFTLSPQTKNILKALRKEIKIVCFYKPAQPGRLEAYDLVRQYVNQSKWVKSEFVDPDRQPTVAKRYKITQYGTVVVECEDKEEKLTGRIDEQAITNAIIRVTREKRKVMYFTKGHGEKEIDNTSEIGYSNIKKELEGQNYEVKDIILAQSPTVPADCAVLIVAGPQKDFFSTEIEMLSDYIAKNGKILFLLDPDTYIGNIKKFLSNFGINVLNGIIVDKISRIFGGDFLVPLISEYPYHEITKNFKIASFFPVCLAIDTAMPVPSGITATAIARTGPYAWLETDLDNLKRGIAGYTPGVDKPGPLNVAVAVEINKFKDKDCKAKMIIFGDSDFICNGNLYMSGNKDFFLNTASWLAEEAELISIRPKPKDNQPLMLTAAQAKLLFLVPLIILPAVTIILGIITLRFKTFIA